MTRSKMSAGGHDARKGLVSAELAGMLTVGEVAELLRCSSRTVCRLTDSGRMPQPAKLGALVRWPREVVEGWIADGCPNSRKMDQCVILPDNDDAGREYAENVVELLGRLMPTPVIRIASLANLPVHGDFVEFLQQHSNNDSIAREKLERLVTQTPPTIPSKPVRPTDEYRTFPVETMPEPIRSFVAEGSKAIGCDAAYIALPMLSALAAAIGNSRALLVKRGWCEPPTLWTAIVGDSGTMKTPAFKLVLKPLRKLQSRMLKEHENEMEAFNAALAQHEVEIATWKRKAKSRDGKAGDYPKEPKQPMAQRVIVSDTTIEGLVPILLANPRGVLLNRDELAGWLGSFDRYSAKKANSDAAHWLSLHSGDSFTVDRKTGIPPTIYVPCASVSVTGGIQPGVLDRVMGREHRESGMFARLLCAYPPRRKKQWSETEISEASEKAIESLFERLFELEIDFDEDDDPKPRCVTMTPDAKAVWIKFYNEHGEEQAELTGDTASAWSKLEGYAARFALIIHHIRWAADDPTLHDPNKVDVASVRAGIALCQWFKHETQRIYGVFSETDEDRERRQLVEWLELHGGNATVRELTKNIRKFRSKNDVAKTALNDLATNGFGQWRTSQSGPGRPTEIFELYECSVPKTPTDDVDNEGFGDGDTGDRVKNVTHSQGMLIKC